MLKCESTLIFVVQNNLFQSPKAKAITSWASIGTNQHYIDEGKAKETLEKIIQLDKLAYKKPESFELVKQFASHCGYEFIMSFDVERAFFVVNAYENVLKNAEELSPDDPTVKRILEEAGFKLCNSKKTEPAKFELSNNQELFELFLGPNKNPGLTDLLFENISKMASSWNSVDYMTPFYLF